MRFLLVWIIIIGVQTYGKNLPYLDDQFECISKDAAQLYITDFNIQISSFKNLDLCNPHADFKKLSNDLYVIANGQFNNSNSNRSTDDGFIDRNNYYTWLKQQTRSITRKSDQPTATAYNENGHFVIQDNWANQSLLGRVGTLIHEARHTHGHPHIACTRGPYSNSPHAFCDPDFNSGGSHSVEVEYYARVSVSGINFHPIYKSMARLMAMARSNFVFNHSSFARREGLMLYFKNDLIYLLDQGRWYKRPITGPISGVLKRTSFGASLFTGTHAYAVDPYESVSPFEALWDSFSYFKILIDLKNTFRDFEEFDIANKRYVLALDHSGNFSTYNFSQGQWNPFKAVGFPVKLSSSFLIDGQQGYFLIDNRFRVFAYQPTTDTFILLNISWDPNIQSVTRVENLMYSLDTSGRVFALKDNQWQLISLPEKRTPQQMVSIPLYNTFNILE